MGFLTVRSHRSSSASMTISCHNRSRRRRHFSSTIAGLLYAVLSVSSAAGQETGNSGIRYYSCVYACFSVMRDIQREVSITLVYSAGGVESVACSTPSDPSQVPFAGLFESETQIVYTSLPFSGSANTTCWHLLLAPTANCSRIEPLVLPSSSTTNLKIQLQILREVKVMSRVGATRHHAFEVMNQVDVGMSIVSREF